MDILKYNKKTYHGPASWEDCDEEYWQRLIPFCRLTAGDRPDEIFAMAVQLVFSIPVKHWAKWILGMEQWAMLKEQIRWVFSLPQVRPFPKFHYAGTEYILMEESFADTTAIELSMAFVAYTDFVNPEEPDLFAIDRLITTICRPQRPDLLKFKASDDWNGDVRETFNEARMIARAKEVASMPLAMKTVILTYFEVQAKAFLEQYEMLFGGDAAPRYGDGRGWIMLLKNIAKEGHFGSFDKVCSQPAHLVFLAALDDTITAEEIRAKQEENGN